MFLPVTVYHYDRRAKEYIFSHCLQINVHGVAPPVVLNCGTGMMLLREGIELLKAAMCAPAVLLINGTHSKALNASGDEVKTMPPSIEVPVVHTYEMMCINIPSYILYYRLRRDGALVLAGCNEGGGVNCLTCHVPATMCASYMRKHLTLRADSIRKLIRDRRVVVEVGPRTCVYSLNTLQRRRVLGTTTTTAEIEHAKSDDASI